MNIIEILGNLGADPETRFTPSGQKVTNLRVAVSVRKAGKEETIWFKVAIWGDRFDKMIAHLKKGSSIIIVGELGKPEIYTDREGRPQVSLEITAEFIRFNPFGRSGEKPTNDQQQQENMQGRFAHSTVATTSATAGSHSANNSFSDSNSLGDLDDGLPF